MTKRKNFNNRKTYLLKKYNNFTCESCNQKKESNELEIDHIIPLIKGGTNDYSNLQVLCIDCHLNKCKNEWKDNIYKQKRIILTAEEKLELLKDFLVENKHKNRAEIQFLISNDPILSGFELSQVVLFKLYEEVNGIKIKRGKDNEKHMAQRNFMLNFLKKRLDMSYRDMESMLNDAGFNVSYRQIATICSKFKDKELKDRLIDD